MIKNPKYKPENGVLKIKLPVRSPLEDYECWYFESILDNGSQIRISFRINETYSVPILYAVHVELIENGQVSKYSESFTSKEVEFSMEKCDHKLGNNWMLDFGEYFETYVEIDEITIQLKFYPEINGFNNRRDSVVNQNILGTKFTGWNVPIPRAKVSGFISQKGLKTNVTGIGYHDHVWGNSSSSKGIKQLCLGKIHDNNISIYYSFIIEDNQSMLGKLILASKDNFYVISEGTPYAEGLNIKIKNNTTVDEAGDEVPKHILIHDNNIELNIELKEMFLQQKIDKHRLGGKNLLRFFGEESYKFKKDGKEFSGKTSSLHEVLIF